MKSLKIGLAGALALALMPLAVSAQGLPTQPPPRPRLLISASDIPALQARIAAGGEPTAAWNLFATTGTWACGTTSGACPGGAQAHWRVDRAMRTLTELALRYAITGDLAAGQSARTMLVVGPNSAVGYVRPGGLPAGNFKPFREGALVASIAYCYDLLHPLLSSAERAQVVQFLEAWIDSFRAQSNAVGSYSSYSGAADNYGFGWDSGIAAALLAIWGESSRANIPSQIDVSMNRLRAGWMDVFSPDGHYDESHGYSNYGGIYSVRVALAARRSGFPNYLAGTNVLRAPRWYLALPNDQGVELFGDTSADHRGLWWDPILYALVQETGDAEAFHGLETLATWRPVSDDSDTMSFSPCATKFLHYPTLLTPRPPAVRSAFFRDNENIAPNNSADWNKTNNNSAVGTGGIAYLRDDSGLTARLGVDYVIRDEWANHSHEDDGHVGLMASGRNILMDLGIATTSSPAFFGAQSLQHNIVSANRESFRGASTNHFSPPPPLGRFHGARLASSFGAAADYVRGDHRTMWMMEEAQRAVALIKDPEAPVVIIHDRVRKGSGTASYEQRWHTPAPMGGAGTATNPYTVTSGTQRMNGVLLAPGSYQKVSSGLRFNTPASLGYYLNEITTSGTGPIDYLLVWSPLVPVSQAPLSLPTGDVRGGTITLPGGRVDHILAGTGPFADVDTSSDGRFVWIRRIGTTLQAWVAGEATVLDDLGTRFLQASERVTVSVRSGRIDISRALAVRGTPFTGTIQLHAPFAVSEVFLDGVSVPFTFQGTNLFVGQAPARPLPPGAPPYTLDRFHRFEATVPTDGVLAGAAFLTSDGRLASRTGLSGTFRTLPQGIHYGGSALSLSLAVEARASVGGLLGAVHLDDASGIRSATVEIWDHPGVGLALYASGLRVPLPGFASVPRLLQEPAVRFTVIFDRGNGRIRVQDRLGREVQSFAMDPLSGAVIPVLEVLGDARFDDCAVLDDAEVLGSPQGVVAWVDAVGRLGFYAGSSDVYGLQDLELVIGSTRFDFNTVLNLFVAFGYSEELVLPFLGGGQSVSANTREMSLVPSMVVPSTTPGVRHVFDMITRSAHRLVDGVVR